MLPTDHGTTAPEPAWRSLPSVPLHAELLIEPVHGIRGGMLRCGAAGFLPDGRASDHAAWTARAEGGSGEAGAWLLQAACLAAVSWNAGPAAPWAPVSRGLPVSVTIPAGALWDGSLAAQVQAALAQSALNANLLELRISERALHEASIEGLVTLSAVSDLGAGLALGLGLEESDSRRMLSGLPLTSVMLDACIVRGLVAYRAARASAAACIGLAHALGARAVALGVETAVQRDILDDLGCDDGQGPLFGLAMPAGLFSASLTADIEA